MAKDEVRIDKFQGLPAFKTRTIATEAQKGRGNA